MSVLSIFDTFATVAPDVEPTHGISVRDKCAILAPNVGPTSNISILDNFATLLSFLISDILPICQSSKPETAFSNAYCGVF